MFSSKSCSAAFCMQGTLLRFWKPVFCKPLSIPWSYRTWHSFCDGHLQSRTLHELQPQPYRLFGKQAINSLPQAAEELEETFSDTSDGNNRPLKDAVLRMTCQSLSTTGLVSPMPDLLRQMIRFPRPCQCSDTAPWVAETQDAKSLTLITLGG